MRSVTGAGLLAAFLRIHVSIPIQVHANIPLAVRAVAKDAAWTVARTKKGGLPVTMESRKGHKVTVIRNVKEPKALASAIKPVLGTSAHVNDVGEVEIQGKLGERVEEFLTKSGQVTTWSEDYALERRTDPYDGRAYTFAEISAYYKKKYTKSQIQAYWDNDCKRARLLVTQASHNGMIIAVAVLVGLLVALKVLPPTEAHLRRSTYIAATPLLIS